MTIRSASLAIVAALLPVFAHAQEPSVGELLERLEQQENRTRVLERKLELKEEAAAAALPTTPVVKAGARGFSISSPDNANAIRLRGTLHFDGRYLEDDAGLGGKDEFKASRIRPTIEGTLNGIFDFRFMPDFGQGRSSIVDAWVTARLRPDLQVTAGKFKANVGLERIHSASDIRFVNRAFPTSLVPNRDLGIQIGGHVLENRLAYQFAFLHGANDGGSSDTFADAEVNNDKEWALRLFTQPFIEAGNFALRGLGFGVAGTITSQTGTTSQTLLPSFRTPATQTFFNFRGNTAASDVSEASNATIADGDRIRLSPQLYYAVGSFGVLGEYVSVEQDVSRQTTATAERRFDTLDTSAWHVQLALFATGEEQAFKGFAPSSVFMPGGEGWGALEFVARYHTIEVDDAAFAGGADSFANPDSASREARSYGVGANWYLNQNFKVHLGYEVTAFEGGAAAGADRDDEKAVLSRFQLAF